MEKEKPRTSEANKYYRCESNIKGCCYITTNDEKFAEQLIQDGAKIICHPSFFNPHTACNSHLVQSVPVVVQIQNLQENQALNHSPNNKHESFLASVY